MGDPLAGKGLTASKTLNVPINLLIFSLVSLLPICGLILSILSLDTIMLRFIPHIKDFSVFRGFSMGFENIFKFVVLPFGLTTGAYIFTKVMRPLVKHWRSQAFRIVVYLGDGLGVCGTKQNCLQHSLLVHSDSIRSGFVPNKDICMWIPVQSLRWLGFHWDFARGLLSIPEDKISVLLASISEVSSSRIVTARLLAQVTRRIISCKLVFFLAIFIRL